jgi:hypothetical protein
MSRSGSVLERETVLWLTLFMGLALIGGGIWLVYLDPAGGMVINLFGASFRFSNVGNVGIFVGQSSWDLLLYGAAEAESGEPENTGMAPTRPSPSVTQERVRCLGVSCYPQAVNISPLAIAKSGRRTRPRLSAHTHKSSPAGARQ